MRLLISLILSCLAWMASAQKPDVNYLDRSGNNGATRVFSVTTPVNDREISTAEGKAKLKPEEQACREVLNAILFEGVDCYNQGLPLVADKNDPFARSLVNPKTKTFMSYCKDVTLENSKKNKQAYHFIIEVNHFNLLRLLKMRGSREAPYEE